MVYQVSQAVKIPVMGLGGISNGEDVAEFLISGAVAVQVGTATFWDPRRPEELVGEYRRFLEREGVASTRDLIGTLRMGG
jgi:dihydroorotate dehydrogenase (NAD+) catalytic subunit